MTSTDIDLSESQRLGISMVAVNPAISRPKAQPWKREERARQKAIRWLMCALLSPITKD